MGTGQHPFLLSSSPYITAILTDCSFCLAISSWFLAWLISWRSWWHIPPKCRLEYVLHDATSQKMENFIPTAVRTSNPTKVFHVAQCFNLFCPLIVGCNVECRICETAAPTGQILLPQWWDDWTYSLTWPLTHGKEGAGIPRGCKQFYTFKGTN
jgi:hypothetical protein